MGKIYKLPLENKQKEQLFHIFLYHFWSSYPEEVAQPSFENLIAVIFQKLLFANPISCEFLDENPNLSKLQRGALTWIKDNTITSPQSYSSDTIQISPALNFDDATYGEEFEYLIPDLNMDYKITVDEKLKQWHQLLNVKINDFYGNLKENEDFEVKISQRHGYEMISCRIGDWHFNIYEDFGVIEVNTSPYNMRQLFSIGSKDYSSSTLFNYFIFSIANTLELKGVSGHKHVDIKHLLHGNTELLFRFQVMLETMTWLPLVFQREEEIHCFQYATCENRVKYDRQKMFVSLFNEQMQINSKPRTGHHSDSIRFGRLVKPDDVGEVCRYRFTKSYDAESPRDTKVCEPETTIELRLFPCPRTGEEAMLINELINAMFLLALRDQQEQKKIEFNPLPVENYTPEIAKDCFFQWIKENSLDEKFKELYRPRDSTTPSN